jgi:hypothetical protein
MLAAKLIILQRACATTWGWLFVQVTYIDMLMMNWFFHIFDFLNDGSILGMATSFLLIFVWTHTTSLSTYLVWVGN